MGKIQLIDAETLYYKPLIRPQMIIDGILSSGLAIMAGDSKIGKSWMVLWLGLKISNGEPVWGFPTHKTNVVYLALEDHEGRIQQRMQDLTDTPPENLKFGFSCGRLGQNLERQITEVLNEWPSTGLIFIDTLQMVRDNVSSRTNAYAQDYKDLSALKKIADTYPTFIRLPNIHTITATFTRLPLTFTRILFWELSGKEQKKQKRPGGKLLRQGILHTVIV